MKAFKQIAMSITVVMLFSFVASQAHAWMGGECMFTLSKDKYNKLADKNKITVPESARGDTRTLDFGKKTLSTVKPGDVVTTNGEPHLLTQKTDRIDSTHYVLTKPSALSNHLQAQTKAK